VVLHICYTRPKFSIVSQGVLFLLQLYSHVYSYTTAIILVVSGYHGMRAPTKFSTGTFVRRGHGRGHDDQDSEVQLYNAGERGVNNEEREDGARSPLGGPRNEHVD